MVDNGDIYKGKYEGLYCVHDESFCTEEDAIKKDGKKLCPDCNRELKWFSEENYFFKLSKYQDKLLKLYEDKPDFTEPSFRRNEMLQIIKGGLHDLSISRTSFNWGIPLPNDPEHVIYVWVDALLNYISALGYNTDNNGLFEKFWPADLHLIGKEINRFHSIIWPAILMSLDLPLPRKVFAHGWLTVNGEKISKSRGNAIDPRLLTEAYGKDAVVYYLLRDINFGKDGDFSEDNLIGRINSDLANDLGNLLHRTTAMIKQNFEGVIPVSSEEKEAYDIQFQNLLDKTLTDYLNYMDTYKFTQALETIWALIGFSNKYIDLTQPWKLAKDEGKKERLAVVLYNLSDTLRNIALFLKPIMKDTSLEIFRRLGIEDKWEDSDFSQIKWGLLEPGSTVIKEKPIFPRLDPEKIKKVIIMNDIEQEAKEEKIEGVALIGFEDFTKIQLRVAEIVEAEPVPKSKKLMKLQLELGEDEKRQIVAGISQYYTAEELIGKKIIVVANLKPAKLMGVQSNGMLLAAKDGENFRLLTADGPINPGAKIS
jgi:methionyl-tRNA synthetase